MIKPILPSLTPTKEEIGHYLRLLEGMPKMPWVWKSLSTHKLVYRNLDGVWEEALLTYTTEEYYELDDGYRRLCDRFYELVAKYSHNPKGILTVQEHREEPHLVIALVPMTKEEVQEVLTPLLDGVDTFLLGSCELSHWKDNIYTLS